MHLLYICVGVSIWEDIWVLLPEDMAHSAAGDNLEAAPTHPHSKGDFCKTARLPSLLCTPGREGTHDSSFKALGPRKWRGRATPSLGCSTVTACALLAGQPQFPHLPMGMIITHTWERGNELIWKQWLAWRSTYLNQPLFHPLMEGHIQGPTWWGALLRCFNLEKGTLGQ